jgi:hypothetical protein
MPTRKLLGRPGLLPNQLIINKLREGLHASFLPISNFPVPPTWRMHQI